MWQGHQPSMLQGFCRFSLFPIFPAPVQALPALQGRLTANATDCISWGSVVAVCNSFLAGLPSTSSCASSQGRALKERHAGHLVMPAARPTHTKLLTTPSNPRGPTPPRHQHWLGVTGCHTPACGPCHGVELGPKCFLTDYCNSSRSQHAWWLLCGHFVYAPPYWPLLEATHAGPQRVHTTPAAL